MDYQLPESVIRHGKMQVRAVRIHKSLFPTIYYKLKSKEPRSINNNHPIVNITCQLTVQKYRTTFGC